MFVDFPVKTFLFARCKMMPKDDQIHASLDKVEESISLLKRRQTELYSSVGYLFSLPWTKYVNDQMDFEEKKCALSLVMASFCSAFGKEAFSHNSKVGTESLGLFLKYLDENLSLKTRDNKAPIKPARWVRYWLPVSVSSLVLNGILRRVKISQQDIKLLVGESASAVKGLAINWIFNPVSEIWGTIRYNSSKLAITGAKSLSSDLQVLW